MEPTFEYTYDMFTTDIPILVEQIKANTLQDFDLILGVSRGGLLPAVRLSHVLGVPMLAINYSLKDPRRKFAFNNETRSIRNFEKKRILLVEDLCDSGKTLAELRDTCMQDMFVATCVPLYKPHTSCIKPNFYARTYDGNGWVDFFWEQK